MVASTFIQCADTEVQNLVNERIDNLLKLGRKINGPDSIDQATMTEAVNFTQMVTSLMVDAIDGICSELGTTPTEKLEAPATQHQVIDAQMEMIIFLLTGMRLQTSTMAVPVNSSVDSSSLKLVH